MPRPGDLADALRQALFPPDPGRVRLLGAARATLGGVLALAAVMAFDHLPGGPLPFTDRVTAFAIALFLGAAVRDSGRRRQAETIALAALPVFAATVLAALALRFEAWHLPEALTVALVFAAIAAAGAGPRWAAFGLLALMGLLISLLTHAALADLPSRLLAIVLGCAGTALVRLTVLPDRPGAALRRLLLAARATMEGICGQIEHAVATGSWHGAERQRLRRAIARLNEAVMLVQPMLAPERALHLLELELIVERVGRVAAVDLGTAAERPSLLVQLGGLRSALRGLAPPPDPGHPAGRLARVLAAFALRLAEPTADLEPPPAPMRPAAPAGWHGLDWHGLDWRPATQAGLATALAIAGGWLVDPTHWFWAVFASFALFQGTRSRGETAQKAVQMVAGTVAGVVVGVLAATALHGQVLLSFAAVIAGIFLAFFASTAAYGVMVFWLTVILGLLFGMLGYFPPQVLLLRLEETAVGAASGSLVAWLVLAQRGPDLVRTRAAAFLAALEAVVEAALPPLLGRPADPRVLALTLAQEQRFQALRAAGIAPLPAARLVGGERLRRLLQLLAACDHWSRELARTSLTLAPLSDGTLATVAGQAAARVAESIVAIAARLEGQAEPAAPPHAEPAALPAVPEGDDPPTHAVRLLLRLDSALLHLRQRLPA